jgi:hypothetical protein
MKMLSDACFDFVTFTEEGRPVAESAKEFLRRVEGYGVPDYPVGYPPEHIEALKKAARALLANPEDKQLTEQLIALATAVQVHYDSDGKEPLHLPIS